MEDQTNPTFPSPQRKGLAITSLVLGIISIPTAGLLCAGGIVGIILGVVALNKVKADPAQYAGRGLAIAGIITSSFSLLLAIPGVIAAVAIPNLIKSQQAAREAAAMADVRTIGNAQLLYSIENGLGRFTDLRTLGAMGLIDARLASGEKGGYVFTSEPVIAEGMSAMFDVTARPVTVGKFGTGNRAFYMNETMVLYEGEGGEPPTATARDRVPTNGEPIQ
ncbi:MAG TPA: DUF4190 domain-containing protein [Blastocatellia bacterium]|nr:DUF4190 domain-containing protein [Blastocatellia bacterium]